MMSRRRLKISDVDSTREEGDRRSTGFPRQLRCWESINRKKKGTREDHIRLRRRTIGCCCRVSASPCPSGCRTVRDRLSYGGPDGAGVVAVFVVAPVEQHLDWSILAMSFIAFRRNDREKMVVFGDTFQSE